MKSEESEMKTWLELGAYGLFGVLLMLLPLLAIAKSKHMPKRGMRKRKSKR